MAAEMPPRRVKALAAPGAVARPPASQPLSTLPPAVPLAGVRPAGLPLPAEPHEAGAKRQRTNTNTKRWTSDEETRLVSALDVARKTHKGASVWTEVARIMGDDRTDSALQQHW